MPIVKQNINYALEINTGYTSESDVSGLGLSAGNIRFITGQEDKTLVASSAPGTYFINNWANGESIDTAFLNPINNWSITATSGGEKYLTNNDYAGQQVLGFNTSGNFFLEFEMKIGDTIPEYPGYGKVELYWSFDYQAVASVIWDWSSNTLMASTYDSELGASKTTWITSGIFAAAPLASLKCRFTRIDGIVKIYHYDGSNWVNEVDVQNLDSHPLTRLYMGCWPSTEGYSYITMSADDGLPYDYVTSSTFYDGFLVKNGMTNPSRQIDISKTGNYGDLSNFSFKVNNSLKYWNLLTSAGNANLTQDINLINKPVKVYTVINDTFYQIWTGVVSDISRNEKEFIINCEDRSNSIHKNLPREIIQDKVVPVSLGTNDYVKVENVTSGDQEVELNIDKTISTIFNIVGTTDYDDNTFKLETYIHTDKDFQEGELDDKYIKMITGGTLENPISDELLIKIDHSYTTEVQPYEIPTKYANVTRVVTSYLFKGTSDPTYYRWNVGNMVILPHYSIENLPERYKYRGGSNENNAYLKVIDPFNKYAYNVSGTELINNLVYSYNEDTNLFDVIPGEVVNNDDGSVKIISPNILVEGASKYFSNLDFTLNSITLKINPDNTYYGLTSSTYNPCLWENYITFSGDSLSAVLDKDQTTFLEIPISGGFVGTDPIPADIFLEFDYNINSELYDIDAIYALPDISIVGYYGSSASPIVTSGVSEVSLVNFPMDINNNVISFADPDSTIGCVYPIKNELYQRSVSSTEIGISGDNVPILPIFNIPEEIYNNIYTTSSVYTFIPEFKSRIKQYEYNAGTLSYDWTSSSAADYMTDICKINDTSLIYYKNKICNRFKLIVRLRNETVTEANIKIHEFGLTYLNDSNINNNVWIKANGISGTNTVYGVFKYILENSDEIPTSAIDYGNLELQRGDLSQWEAGRQITNRENSKNYLRELCEQSYVALFPDRFGKRKFNCYLTSSAPVATFDENTIIRNSIKTFKASPIKDVYNEFIVDYDFNPATDEAAKHINITKTDQSSFPALSGDWTSYVTGITNYYEAERLWTNAHLGYVLTNSVVTNPRNLQELKWYHNDEGSAYLFLDSLIQWTSVQHYDVEFSIPLISANIERELTDKITFNDILLTNNTDFTGYIDKIEYDINNDKINIGVIADQGNYNPTDKLIIIETGSAPNIIQESGSRETIYVEGEQN